MSESESKSTSDHSDFIPTHLIESEPFFERRGTREAPVVPPREGLPSTYRMRADAHYVDQLMEPSARASIQVLKVDDLDASGGVAAPPLVASIERHGVLQPLLVQRRSGRYRVLDGQKRLASAKAAGLMHVPCLLHDVDDAAAAALTDAANLSRDRQASAPGGSGVEAAAAIGRDLVHALASMSSSLNLLAPSANGLSRLVAVDLIRAELWRASCLAEIGRVLRAERPIALTSVTPARILDRVTGHVGGEARLRGVQIEIKAVDVPADATIRGDENLLVVALSAMLLTTLGLTDDSAPPRVAMSVSARAAANIVFDVSQDAVIVPAEWASRAFDATWVDRPGGLPALVWMLGIERIAAALGGKAAVVATVLGTTISLTIPVSTRK